MYQFITDENNKILNYVPTTYKLINTETERPRLPEKPKPEVDYVEYWDDEKQQIVLKEESRPLTLEERVAAAENKADASMEAIAELYESGNQ